MPGCILMTRMRMMCAMSASMAVYTDSTADIIQACHSKIYLNELADFSFFIMSVGLSGVIFDFIHCDTINEIVNIGGVLFIFRTNQAQ